MERPKRKAINFDLDTNAMKERTIYPVGYELLRLSFEERGFYHRQGSGYISIEKMTHSDVNFIIKSITEENLWLADCVKRIDVTDIGKQHDLTAVVKAIGAQYAEQAAQEAQARREKHEATRSAGQQSPSGQKRPVANMAGVLERLKEMCPMYAEDVATEGKAAADAKFERVFKSTKIKRSALDKVVRSNKGKGKA